MTRHIDFRPSIDFRPHHTQPIFLVLYMKSHHMLTKQKPKPTRGHRCLPGEIDWKYLLSGLLTAEDPAERSTRFSSTRLIVIRELIRVKHGIGHHGVRGHLRTLTSQFNSSLSRQG